MSTILCPGGFRGYSSDYNQSLVVYFIQCMSHLSIMGSQCIDYARPIMVTLWFLYVCSDLLQSTYLFNSARNLVDEILFPYVSYNLLFYFCIVKLLRFHNNL